MTHSAPVRVDKAFFWSVIFSVFHYCRNANLGTWAPFTDMIPECISNNIYYKMWGEITYSFPNFNSAAIGDWECTGNFIPPIFTSIWLLIHAGIKVGLSPSAKYMRQWIGSTFGVKSLSKPVPGYCQLVNKLQWNLNRNTKLFIYENAFENVVYEMTTIPFCQGEDELIKGHCTRLIIQVSQ